VVFEHRYTENTRYTISNKEEYFGPNLSYHHIYEEQDFLKYIDNAIVIYPEIVSGNPLQASRVVRYMLNREGVASKRSMEASETDFILTFSRIYHEYPHATLMKLSMECLFNNECTTNSLMRPIDLTYFGKGPLYNECFVVPNSIALPRGWPQTKRELALLLRNSRFFYTWDIISQTNIDALFCGSIPVIMCTDPFESMDELNRSELGIHPYASLTGDGENRSVYIPSNYNSLVEEYKINYLNIVNGYDAQLNFVLNSISKVFHITR
jgi:hypothetical protein